MLSFVVLLFYTVHTTIAHMHMHMGITAIHEHLETIHQRIVSTSGDVSAALAIY